MALVAPIDSLGQQDFLAALHAGALSFLSRLNEAGLANAGFNSQDLSVDRDLTELDQLGDLIGVELPRPISRFSVEVQAVDSSAAVLELNPCAPLDDLLEHGVCVAEVSITNLTH